MKNDWSYNLAGQPALFADRGFTGHEHLPWFNLVNMNGRLYDPAVGRFLNADPFVQMPGNTQSYNRYSYCLNNPLRYTDPSGNTWWDKFWNWSSEHGIQYGINMGPGGLAPNVSMPGPENIRIAAGFNTQTGKFGVGNNSSGFMNFYFPTYNFNLPEQVTDRAITKAKVSVNEGNVDFGNYKISSDELKGRLNDFANETGYNINVVGGDRNAARNTSVGGSKGSRHLYGDAADIVVRGTPDREVAIQAQGSGLFNTTIYYPDYSTSGALPAHVHVDLNPRHDNVLMIYKIVNGSNKYLPWNP